MSEWPDGEFHPCSMDALCENCGHPMAGHFREKPKGYATACGQCACKYWSCEHGGTRALLSEQEAMGW